MRIGQTSTGGDGVSAALLYGVDNAEGTIFTSGFTTFPTGRAAPMHSHNCCEQVLIISVVMQKLNAEELRLN